MCILLVAWQHHPRYDLVVAGNRDEFHARPASPAAAWHDSPQVVAGRDLEAGGTWLGVGAGGRFAAVTNLQGAGRPHGGRSRGLLVADYLRGGVPAADYAAGLPAVGARHAGVNLLLADPHRLCAWSNRDNRPTELPSGVHGLSNSAMDVEWPKVRRLKAAYRRDHALEGEALLDALLAALADGAGADDPALSDTGSGLEAARTLAPIFILGGGYGTRCSSVVLRERASGRITFVERRFDAQGRPAGDSRHELPGPA